MIWWIALAYMLGLLGTFCFCAYEREDGGTTFGVSLVWPIMVPIGLLFGSLEILYEFFYWRQWRDWKWYRKWKKLNEPV